MKMPDDSFEPLTFGELKVGDKFIVLPRPGDNRGHGGFKGVHHIFTKFLQKTKAAAGLPYGRAVSNKGVSSDFPGSMFVIKVK